MMILGSYLLLHCNNHCKAQSSMEYLGALETVIAMMAFQQMVETHQRPGLSNRQREVVAKLGSSILGQLLLHSS